MNSVLNGFLAFQYLKGIIRKVIIGKRLESVVTGKGVIVLN